MHQTAERALERVGSLEAALEAAADEIASVRAQLDEAVEAAAAAAPILAPDHEPTVDSDDASSLDGEEEAEVPVASAAEQWKQLFLGAKAKAASKAKALAMTKSDEELRPAKDWDIETFRRVETTVQTKRTVPITNKEVRPPRKGKAGAIRHERMGLAGAVQYWARGSRKNALLLVMKLVRHFGLEASVREQLYRKDERDHATDTYMVDRARAFIQASKGCSTAEQHRQFLIALSIFAPPRAEVNDQHGMANRVAKRLGVTPGRRTKRAGEKRGRQRAFDRAIDLRAKFDERLAELYVPMQMVGEEVLCRGQLGKLSKYDEATGRCEITFSYDGVEKAVPFASRFGKEKGSARLQRPPALLLPPPRERTKDAISAETREHVQSIYELTCATSPYQKDERKRRLARHVYQTKQALVQMLPLDDIYRIFQKTYPLDKLSMESFRLLKPWNVIKAYRETCLCRCCELFRLYVQALLIVGKLLKPLVTVDEQTDDAEGAEAEAEATATEAEAVDPDLVWIVDFCKCQTKSEMANMLVCGGCLETAKPDCVNGKCSECSFARRWKHGLRPRLVNSEKASPDCGKLLDGVSALWEHEVRYEVLKSSGSTPSDGSNEDKETLRAQRVGTVIQFLDAFEEASVKFPAHRHLIGDAKAKARRRERYFWPGMLLSDYDWSENGVINNARQIQSEYWALTHYSLFISITTYLIVEAWLDRLSLLSVGSEVPCHRPTAHRAPPPSVPHRPTTLRTTAHRPPALCATTR